MNNQISKTELDEYKNQYMHFMGIDAFPNFKLQLKSVSLQVANRQGYDTIATALYQPETGRHELVLAANLILEQYILFHEFTHMLDSEYYSKGDKLRYAWLSGYTEYHASQVELMQMLGANSINDEISFSMDSKICTIAGEKSVADYVNCKYQHAIDLFSRSDFPADISTLKTSLGVLFNYYGLRSICEMYSINFKEEANTSAFRKFISDELFDMLNCLMHKWLDNHQIEQSMTLYRYIICILIKKYNLI